MNEFELFQSALEIDDPAARKSFLNAACDQNEELIRRVNALLASHDSQSQFLDTPVGEQIGEDRTNADIEATSWLPNGSFQIDADEEIPLGYLESSTKLGSLGRLAHYEIMEVVGRGAFGTVLRAFDEKLHRIVAIKVMALELAATSPARKRFMREAQASAAIRHEYVVSVFAVEEKPLPYLVMEYIPGRTLQQRLNERGPLDVSTVLRFGRQIAEGLAAAHAQGLIHRDIKPGNILLETIVQDRVKISDFGLARAADDASLTQSGTIAGTPMYMAPEQALGNKLDQRADLFSLGSVMYQMVSGRPPFRASTALAVLKRVVDETPRPIREIIPETPQWLCDIISKLHAKSPDDRFQTASEIAEVLANCESQLKAQAELKDFSLIPPSKTRTTGQTETRTMGWWKWAAVACLSLPALVFGASAFSRRVASPGVTGNETTNIEMPRVPSQGPVVGVPDSEGWVQLFNNKDLTGWKLLPGHVGDWKVKDGILQGSSRQSHLFSQRDDYQNFHLRAEVKINLGGDGGILFRAPFKLVQGRPNNFGIPGCYEVKIQEDRSFSRRTGSILRALGDAPPVLLGLVSDDTLAQPDEWFSIEIITENDQFITKINGLEVANCNDSPCRHKTGHLSLQVWNPNTLIQFRKIEIKELPTSSSVLEEQAKRRFASDEWIDVIPLIDTREDKWDMPQKTGKNAWRIEQGELVVNGDGFGSKLLLPLDSDWSAFECEIDFTRRAGNSGFNLNLPAKLGDCPLVLDPPGNNGAHFGSRTKGVHLTDGVQVVTGQRSTLRVELRGQQGAGRMSLEVNGQKIGEWTGDRNTISNNYQEGYPAGRRASLWIHPGGNEFVFHRIRVRMLDGGQSETLRPVSDTP